MSDRQYCRQSGMPERAVHVFRTWTRVPGRARTGCNINLTEPAIYDRIPSDGHLCGNCSRREFAQTDVEPTAEDPTFGVAVPI